MTAVVDITWTVNSLFWSATGLVVGVVLGYLLRVYQATILPPPGDTVTTPERLRARQRRESVGIALLALGLVSAVIYFEGQDAAQERCMATFIAADNETSTIRSGLVEDESRATRQVIRASLSAKSLRDIKAAKREYNRALYRIDKARENNPVREFPEGVCD